MSFGKLLARKTKRNNCNASEIQNDPETVFEAIYEVDTSNLKNATRVLGDDFLGNYSDYISMYINEKKVKPDAMIIPPKNVKAFKLKVEISCELTFGVDSMFAFCTTLLSVDFIRFNTGECNNFRTIFLNCRSLREIDLSGWDSTNVTTTCAMFAGCYSLVKIRGFENWNIENLNSALYMFENCFSLVDTPEIKKFSGKLAFFNCNSALLKYIK